ncbi:hypothetical protein H5410_022362 [Solanum commersonii]|uniref:Uncharacterized protein n=1 Tax=Solanum commersonii TaxID=4109 RepID=A0A9J5ZDY9_SOLCO|nr:hypothetical protein H5410_022362 [Solanum commersonii]
MGRSSWVPSRATYPVSNVFFSDTHLPHECQPTPYPTPSLELSRSLFRDLPLGKVENTWGGFVFATTNPLN